MVRGVYVWMDFGVHTGLFFSFGICSFLNLSSLNDVFVYRGALFVHGTEMISDSLIGIKS